MAGTGVTYIIQNQAADAAYNAAADTVVALIGTSVAPTTLAHFVAPSTLMDTFCPARPGVAGGCHASVKDLLVR